MGDNELPIAVARLLDAAADKHSVPRTLARAVAWVESRGATDAKETGSAAGGQGVMQLSSEMATQMQVREPLNAESNIDAGVRLLSIHLHKFANPVTAAAAYHWGVDNVEKATSAWPVGVVEYVNHVGARERVEVTLADLEEQRARMQRADPLPPPAQPEESESKASKLGGLLGGKGKGGKGKKEK